MRARWLGLGLLLISAPARAQDSTTLDRVRVGIVYQPGVRPGIVILPAQGLDSVRAIIARDLDYSDRFEVIPLPDGGASSAPVTGGSAAGTPSLNYALLSKLNAVLALELVRSANGSMVTVRLHDLVTSRVRNERGMSLDPSGLGDSRLGIHAVADEVVRWATGAPGIAATRMLYQERGSGRIYRIDSDGYGPTAVTPPGQHALSPAWSPTGDKFAFVAFGEGAASIVVQTIGTGTRVTIPTTSTGMNITPAFSPDGKSLAFARIGEQATSIYTVNVADLCCVERIAGGRFAHNLSPVYSPDARRMAFASDRTGSPQIYAMAADGTDQELLVPGGFGADGPAYAPDWSPDGSAIVFHREVSRSPQVFVYQLSARRVKQITSSGRNEDPSWAPDGRHIVYVSDRAGRPQLHIIDLETARVRQLAAPGVARLPAWSRALSAPR